MVAVLAISSLFSKSPLNSIGFGVAAAVMFVGGMLLLCLGVLGEYLGRVYDEVRNRPLSIINKVYSTADAISVQASLDYEEEEQARVPEAQVAWDLKYPVATPEQETVRFPAPQEA
jgi:dolichol-phosphate mannosyltransferase